MLDGQFGEMPIQTRAISFVEHVTGSHGYVSRVIQEALVLSPFFCSCHGNVTIKSEGFALGAVVELDFPHATFT
jgi:hypothetical protein